MPIDVQVETTPNPNSRKFVVGQQVAASTEWFGSAAEAGNHAIASSLFAIAGVANVMLLNDFVTVGKDGGADWSTVEPAVIEALQSALG